jgi:hypothetical protein
VAENEWTHLAVSYDGQTVRLFVNGVEQESKTPQPFLYSSTQHITFGSTTDGASTNKFIGYLEDVRMINGVSVYSADFTVPTTTLTYVLPGGPSVGWYGDRGVIAGGNSTSIEYIAVATPSNASSFGSLTTGRGNLGGSGISDATYGLCQVGGATNAIEYITFSTIGDASSFGNLTGSPLRNTCVSDGTYGLSGGGYAAAAYLDTIDYVTIASPGNATNFGVLTRTSDYPASGNDATYGLWGGGYNNGTLDVIDYVTMASTGNAIDFGNLIQARFNCSGSHDDTYVVFAGGNRNKSTIDYVTTATPSNATSFGSLTSGKQFMAGGIADGTYGVFAGGGSTTTNVIEYITIAVPSNGTDFGDLSANRSYIMGTAGNS